MKPGLAARDTIYSLAEHLAVATFPQLPIDVVQATKQYITDCLGVTIAGSSAPGCQEVVDQVIEWGGRPEATILTFGNRVPAYLAAFANSAMARALDLDDVFEEAVAHVTCSVLPVALAMAEFTGRTSGRDLVAAVALGRDTLCRLALANRNLEGERGRSQSYQLNTFASAATAGWYLGLNADQMVAAFGLAYGQGMSNRQGVIDGTMAVRIHQGLSAQLGTQAAQLARRGVTGARNVIDGKYGYYHVYEGGRYDSAPVTEGLGLVFRGIESSIKPYPCCKQSHTSVRATIELCIELGAQWADIVAIDIGVNQMAYYTVCAPPEGRYRPRTIFDAQFSAPWSVAVAAVRGTFFLEDLTLAALDDPQVQSVADRVTCRIDEEVERSAVGKISPAVVEIKLRDGRYARKRVDHIKGHPLNPMTFDEIVEKFRRCVPHASIARDPKRIDQSLEMLVNLERVADIREMIGLLA